MAVAEDDWRLEILQLRDQLRGQPWVFKAYKIYREGWDHDHCCACSTRLCEPASAYTDGLHEGYATTASYVWGADYDWICAECFADLAERMGWTDVTPRH